MTIDEPTSPPRTRREARAQSGSHRSVDPTGVNAFFQGSSGARPGPAQRDATDAPAGGTGEQLEPVDDQDAHEEPTTSTAMLRTLFGESEAGEESDEPGTGEVDAFTRAMFGTTAPRTAAPAEPVNAGSPASDAGQPGADRAGVADTTTTAGLAALLGGTPAAVAAEPSAAETFDAEPLDPDDDATRVASVVSGIPGWQDETAPDTAFLDVEDSSAPAAEQDGLPATMAFFAAADAAAAATAAAAAEEAPAAADAAAPAEPTAPGAGPGLGLDLGDDPDESDGPAVAWADESRPATALTWIDTDSVRTRTGPATLAARTSPDDESDLLRGLRRTPGWLRPRVLIPCGVVLALVGAYSATTLLAPLDNVAPAIDAVSVTIEPAPGAAVSWSAKGTSAVDVQGFATAASSGAKRPIASISKVVSVMMVLQEMPLKPGEQGPSFAFDYGDQREYWQYVRSDQSALDVPAGGSLTEYQMLEGVLLGSANNYIDRLADEIWGSKDAFASAAQQWLSDQGLDDTTIISPSGRDERNVATTADLLDLGEIAMRNPVFAEIVGKKSADIPGPGVVKNTNKMLTEDPGVVGIKTGTLDGDWNLLTAKDVKVGDTTVRLSAVALGQDSDKERIAVNRALYAGVEKTLAEQSPTVPKGTVVGTIDTVWGERSDVVTDADAQVVMWNGSTAQAASTLDLGDARNAGAAVGSLTVTGAIDTAKTDVSLKSTVDAPSAWWRLTHPLDLFGLNG
ncbi:D-alanyl-D-alanine carboxypeptidase [Microbacterium sp. KUDC0406]|uniref:D-alanyl-D-alanine carboxypeptidase family protein n=1 Tax=Microbacterium sp. KUDC0406 TaxID=2909588 RepID=UPI001F41141B|nr:D-alanyl-D-alanine carboxypeptidase [Microbacterium sp. KUDC0406]UJP09914.1 D-alanyl-D-alanine carboxypeptidase [Microbacterium sp. KUDC0406]